MPCVSSDETTGLLLRARLNLQLLTYNSSKNSMRENGVFLIESLLLKSFEARAPISLTDPNEDAHEQDVDGLAPRRLLRVAHVEISVCRERSI